MSSSRRSSNRFVFHGVLLTVVLAGLAVGVWRAGWLPAKLAAVFHPAAPKVADVADADETAVADAEFEQAAAAMRAEREMREAGEQYEPGFSTPRPSTMAGADDGAEPADEFSPPASADPAIPVGAAGDLSSPGDRRPVRQAGTSVDSGPFGKPAPNGRRGVVRVGFEEDLPAETPPARSADAPQPANALPPPRPGQTPAPRELPADGEPLPGVPAIGGADGTVGTGGQPGASKTAPRVDDRTAANLPEGAASRSGTLMDRKLIDGLIEANDYVNAQRELSKWYWKDPASRPQIRKLLDAMAAALFFSPQPHYQDPYVVQAGDQLRVIAQRYRLSWEYIAKLNNVDARKIRTGQKLKVVDGPFSAIVSLSGYELIVHLNGSFVRGYPVGVGKEGTTPLGSFTVKNKLVDPTYYGPDGLVIAHDDPKNPLGERWIDIGDSYGIHGTIDPGSIGKNESRGCIRMRTADVEEVYNLLVIGSQVKIQK